MDLRPAFYIIPSQRLWARWANLLHPPYLALHLSFAALGAALASTLHADRTLSVLAAFALAMGIGAHALDLLRGDPLRLSLPRRHLWAAAVASVTMAVAIGIYWTVALGWPWFLVLVAFGGFIVAAYNLELLGGRFHTDHWFNFSWGAFPFLVGYFINEPMVTPTLVLGGIFCYLVAWAQRVLSTRVRLVRRRMARLEASWSETQGLAGTRGEHLITRAWLIGPLEQALALLCMAMPLLAVLLLVTG